MTKLSFGAHPFLLGFEQLERLVERTAKTAAEGYPPFNIEATSETTYRITMAVAGFAVNHRGVTIFFDIQIMLGGSLAVFALLMPLLGALIGALLARSMGLSLGGTTILATLAASASYIAVPAAMRLALPEANPSLSLTASLGITFPFNILFGIPLYLLLAEYLMAWGN